MDSQLKLQLIGLWYRPSVHTGGADVKVAPIAEGRIYFN